VGFLGVNLGQEVIFSPQTQKSNNILLNFKKECRKKSIDVETFLPRHNSIGTMFRQTHINKKF
jgi:hypothetical protein